MTRVSQRLVALMWVAIAVSASSCGPATTPSGTVSAGTWGGPNLRLTVAAASATLEFSCGTATVDGSIPLDRGGTFDVRGQYLATGPGPVIQGQAARPLRFAGSVKSQTLTGRATLSDDNTDLGTFTVALGQAAQLVVCR